MPHKLCLGLELHGEPSRPNVPPALQECEVFWRNPGMPVNHRNLNTEGYVNDFKKLRP